MAIAAAVMCIATCRRVVVHVNKRSRGWGLVAALQMAMLLCFGRLGEVTVFFSLSAKHEAERPEQADECRSDSAVAARAKVVLTTASLSICLRSFQPSGGTFYISVYIRFSTVSAGSFSLNPNCRRIFGSRRATPAACQVRITLGRREEPWKILSRPVT